MRTLTASRNWALGAVMLFHWLAVIHWMIPQYTGLKKPSIYLPSSVQMVDRSLASVERGLDHSGIGFILDKYIVYTSNSQEWLLDAPNPSREFNWFSAYQAESGSAKSLPILEQTPFLTDRPAPDPTAFFRIPSATFLREYFFFQRIMAQDSNPRVREDLSRYLIGRLSKPGTAFSAENNQNTVIEIWKSKEIGSTLRPVQLVWKYSSTDGLTNAR